jgi:adenosylhomocysteinase
MRTMGNMKKSITTDSDFAAWAAARSQKTNRSLAGARLAIPEPQKHAEIKSQAQQWGMTVEDATMTDGHSEEFLCDGTQSIDSITDMRKASGLEAMEYAEQHMPVLRDTMDSLTTRVDFSGIRIAVCLILEPKTAILLRKLKAAGAIVGVYCGPDSTDPRVAEQLRQEGITVESSRDWTAEQAHEAALHLLDESRTSSSTMAPASPASPRSNAPNSRRISLEWPRKRPVAYARSSRCRKREPSPTRS